MVHEVFCSRKLIFIIFREVGPNLSVPDGAKVISAKGMLVLPGRSYSLQRLTLTCPDSRAGTTTYCRIIFVITRNIQQYLAVNT